MEAAEHRGRAMASEVQIVVLGGPPDSRSAGFARLAALEQAWSRFRPDSDISRLNRAAGAWTRVRPATGTLLRAMAEGWRLTGGRFDPRAPHTPAGSADGPAFDLEISAGRARIPAGARLDPGAIGKGLAADLVASALVSRGASAALVSVGGDLAVAGPAPDGGWPVDVEPPGEPDRVLHHLSLRWGGVATSTARGRSSQPHVVDPARAARAVTDRFTRTDLAAATVWAPSGWEAEVHATAALLCGTAGVVDYLGRRHLEGLAVSTAGEVLSTAGLAGAPRAARVPAALGPAALGPGVRP